jgi:hypothetical protein
MDLNIAINRLLPGAKYRLSGAIPPHKIIEWRDVRPQPTPEELQVEWEAYSLEMSAKEADLTNFKREATEYKCLLPGSDETIIILLKEKL